MICGRLTTRSPMSLAEGGFTLVELMIATVIYTAVTAGLMTGFTALLRNYEATRDFAVHHADEMRISDYLALDFRRASAVPSAAMNDTTIRIPSYYDVSGIPQTPSLDGQGGVYYGTSGSYVTIHYYLSNGSIYRRENNNQPVRLADNVADFIFTQGDPTQPGQAVTTDTKVIATTITFKPTFKSSGASVAAIKGTTFYNRILLRNKIY